VLEEFVVQTADQLRALAHPMRQRILRVVGFTPRPNKQVAEALGEHPARTHFHMRELVTAGLIEVVEERPKRGIIEKYYRSAALRYRVDPILTPSALQAADGQPGVQLAALQAAEEELRRTLAAFGGPPTGLRIAQQHGCLTPDAQQRVVAHLQAVADELRGGAGSTTSAESDCRPFVLTYVLLPLPPEEAGGDEGAPACL
jgi:DNA-binding transcriptional ArsR family regulator